MHIDFEQDRSLKSP